MWWAKYFRIYYQSKNLAVGQTEYMGILDMIPTEFNAIDKSILSYSTLDHVVEKPTGLCQEIDSYNCRILPSRQ